jgi:hypothetical protein
MEKYYDTGVNYSEFKASQLQNSLFWYGELVPTNLFD